MMAKRPVAAWGFLLAGTNSLVAVLVAMFRGRAEPIIVLDKHTCTA